MPKLLVVAVLLAVTACNGPLQAGSAAVLGEVRVPIAIVQERIAGTLRAGTAQPDAVARDVLTRTVLHELAVEAVRRGDLDLTAAPARPPTALAGELPVLARERAFVEQVAVALALRDLDRLVVTADVARYRDPVPARRLAALAARNEADADRIFDRDGTRGSLIVAADIAAIDPGSASDPPFGVPPGRVAVYEASPTAGTWVVLRVARRATVVPAGAGPVAPGLHRTALVPIGLRMLQPLADELGVRVDPRFGEWDPLRMRVVRSGAAVGEVRAVTG
ncbi:MAG: hypothetical protein ACT4RN_11405 [Pseudonocardia sp.]